MENERKSASTALDGGGIDDVQSEEFRLIVGGMTCEGCVTRISDALLRIPGVHEAPGDLASRSFSVVVDPTRVSPEVIDQAVAEAGEPGDWDPYKAELIEIVTPGSPTSPSDA